MCVWGGGGGRGGEERAKPSLMGPQPSPSVSIVVQIYICSVRVQSSHSSLNHYV